MGFQLVFIGSRGQALNFLFAHGVRNLPIKTTGGFAEGGGGNGQAWN